MDGDALLANLRDREKCENVAKFLRHAQNPRQVEIDFVRLFDYNVN